MIFLFINFWCFWKMCWFLLLILVRKFGSWEQDFFRSKKPRPQAKPKASLQSRPRLAWCFLATALPLVKICWTVKMMILGPLYDCLGLDDWYVKTNNKLDFSRGSSKSRRKDRRRKRSRSSSSLLRMLWCRSSAFFKSITDHTKQNRVCLCYYLDLSCLNFLRLTLHSVT